MFIINCSFICYILVEAYCYSIGMAGQFMSKHVAVKQVESKMSQPRRSSCGEPTVTVHAVTRCWVLTYDACLPSLLCIVRLPVLLISLILFDACPLCMCVALNLLLVLACNVMQRSV